VFSHRLYDTVTLTGAFLIPIISSRYHEVLLIFGNRTYFNDLLSSCYFMSPSASCRHHLLSHIKTANCLKILLMDMSSVVCWQSNVLGQDITQQVWWPLFCHCPANAVEQSAPWTTTATRHHLRTIQTIVENV